ncbi:type II toxin-antitoxin system HipA family toxin [Candidatus Poriferisodalis sp.]|uniref:type II toxin-antitoxin system HipA family toxin n=1 Tax=Candidatus Poriferisodalis sp. TaxID=3101277 RepID=UPI003B02C05C
MRRSDRTEAHILLHGEAIGLLWQSQGTTTLELAQNYWDNPDRAVLGQRFEEREPSFLRQGSGRLPVWFSNLLPEGRLRSVMADHYGFNERNEFRLLLELGVDLPGAISVDTEGAYFDNATTVDSSTTLDDEDDDGLRFSISGVQLKLSMMQEGIRLVMPPSGQRGGFIVKFASREYPDLAENEFSMMRWAHAAGIVVPACELRRIADLGPLPHGFEPLADTNAYVVERFDRALDESGQTTVHMTHMEDFNQIVGQWPEHKYRSISFERLGLLVFALCGPEDFDEFVRRLIFCIVIGNEDAHLKNWSLWYPDRVQPRLSPAYDLISTCVYPELVRGMSLRLFGDGDPRSVRIESLRDLASSVGGSASRIETVAHETLERIRVAWSQISGDLPLSQEFVARLSQYQESLPLCGGSSMLLT